VLLFVVLALFLSVAGWPASACCPCPPSGKYVVNADQTVIIIWDPESKTEHFIRQASFKSEAEDFGFLIPTPTQPVLDESGNEAFRFLLNVTAPEVRKVKRPSTVGCGCGAPPANDQFSRKAEQVRVLAEKLVAGFNASVLEASSTAALVQWLKEHGYAFSPEVAKWAKPYVDKGWKITALKIAKNKDEKANQRVAASALRLSFKTDRPLFPYREPYPKNQLAALHAHDRLLRIYFLGEGRYAGELTREAPWTGTVAWANRISSDDRQRLFSLLRLPSSTGPKDSWLTEFEDHWPYRVAPADLYFSVSADQGIIKREPIIVYANYYLPTDVSVYALAAVMFGPFLVRHWRRRRGQACSK